MKAPIKNLTHKQYKWATPQEWLLDQIDNEWMPEQVQQCARELVMKLDSDTIQDLYQSDMDADDYFSPLCEECNEPIYPSKETYSVSHAATCSKHPDNRPEDV